jgi:hypothetical protein
MNWSEDALGKALTTDPNGRDESGITALWSAVYTGRLEWVQRLLDAGARLDAHDPKRIDRASGDGHVVSIWRGVLAAARIRVYSVKSKATVWPDA